MPGTSDFVSMTYSPPQDFVGQPSIDHRDRLVFSFLALVSVFETVTGRFHSLSDPLNAASADFLSPCLFVSACLF